MIERTSHRRSVTGVRLHLRTWEPEGEVTGALFLSHGLGEHCGRYAHVAEHFTAKGWAVFGQDHYGFGLSEGRRGDVPSFDVLAQDLNALRDELRRERGDSLRLVLLGHSMGGLVALSLLRLFPGAFREAVVIAPALDVSRGVNPVLLALSKVLRVLLPFVTLDNTLAPEDICSDEAVVEAYRSDPLVHRRISPRLFGGMVDEGRRLRGAPAVLGGDLRLLLLHGSGDPICAREDTERLHDALALEHKELEIFPDMLHEILNEKEQARVLARIDYFLG